MQRVPGLADQPVVFISACARAETIAKALDAGAADYIVKPFSPTELTAWVRAALRRRAEPEPFRPGDLAIRYEQRRVTVAGRPVDLTHTGYELMRVLSPRAGHLLTYGSPLRQAWRGRDREVDDPKLVRAVAKRLRRKLGDDAARTTYILNERGIGYRMPGPGDLQALPRGRTMSDPKRRQLPWLSAAPWRPVTNRHPSGDRDGQRACPRAPD